MQRRSVLIPGCFLFLGTWLLLSATSAGHFFVADEMCYFYMAQSFADHGTFDVPSRAVDINVAQAQLGKDGKYYAPHSFGHSLYVVPWVWAGRLCQRMLGAPWAPVFTFSFAHSLTISLTWTLFFFILVSYGLRVSRALVFAAVSLVSTLAFPYARSLFAEPVLALGLTGAWLCFRARGRYSFSFALMGAGSLAFSLTVRPAAAVLLPGFWLLAWQQLKSDKAGPERSPGVWSRVAQLASVAAISLVGLFLFGYYNYVRFGAFATIGYPPLSSGQSQGFSTPLWFGLAVFLASPGKAIWLFNPLLLLSAFGWKRVWNRERTAALFVAWVSLSNLVLYSLWTQPEGGFCWGPRFIVGVLPVMLLPAALFWHETRSRTVARAMAALVLVGLLVQVIGTSVNHSAILLFEGMVPRFASKAIYYDAPDRYNLAFSPFPAHVDKIKTIVSSGTVMALRPQEIRAFSARSTTHSFPFWSDTFDIWAIHLLKDGYPAGRVLGIEALLIVAGSLSILLAFRTAADQLGSSV